MKANAIAKENKKPIEERIKPKIEVQKKLDTKPKSISTNPISNMINNSSNVDPRKLIDV